MPDNSDKTERYYDLRAQEALLAERAAQASDLTRPLYANALTAASSELEELAKDPQVREDLAFLGHSTLKAMAELDELEGAVKLGILPATDVATKREELLSDPRRIEATRFVRQLGLVEAAMADKPARRVPAAEKEQAPKPLTITIRDTVLRIGAKGKFIRTSDPKENQQDYSFVRIGLLKTLVRHQGEELPIATLWAEAFGSDNFDRDSVRQFTMWASKRLVHGGKPLILHNGKRGPASAYTVNPRFNVRIVNEAVTTREEDSPALPVPVQPVQADSATDSAPEVKIPASERHVDRPKFPLSFVETALVAAYIGNKAEFLERTFGIPTIDPEIVAKLVDKTMHKDVEVALATLAPYIPDHAPTQDDLRRLAFAKLKDFFENDDYVFQTIESMNPNDERYPLFEYLYMLEPDPDKVTDHWQLFEDLLDAASGTSYRTNTRNLQITGVVNKIRLGGKVYVLNAAGDIVDDSAVNASSGLPDETAPRVPEAAQPLDNGAGAMIIDLTDRQELEPEPVDVAEESFGDDEIDDDAGDDSAIGRELNDECHEFEDLLRQSIHDWLDVIEMFSLEGKDRIAIGRAFQQRGFTGLPYDKTPKIVSASERGFLSRGGRNGNGLAVEDILTFNALSTPPFGSAMLYRSSSRPDRRLVERTIRDEVARYKERLREKTY